MDHDNPNSNKIIEIGIEWSKSPAPKFMRMDATFILFATNWSIYLFCPETLFSTINSCHIENIADKEIGRSCV